MHLLCLVVVVNILKTSSFSPCVSDTIAFHTVLTTYDSINGNLDEPVPFNVVLVNDGDG